MIRTLLPEQQLSTQVQGKLNDHDTYLNETVAVAPSDYMYSEQLSSFLVSFPESNQLDVTHLTLKLFDGELYTDSRRVLKNTVDGETFTDLPINSLIPDLPYEVFRNDEQGIYYKYLSMGADEMSLDHSISFDLGRAMLTTALSNGTSDVVELTQGLSETAYFGGFLSRFTTTNNLYGFAVQPTGANNTYTNTDIAQIMDNISRTGRDLQCMIAVNDQGVTATGWTLFYKDSNNVVNSKRFVHSVNGVLPDQHGNINVSTVANSEKLDNLDSTQFLRSDTVTIANARLQVKDGIDIISGRLKLMAAAIPQTDHDYILQYDGMSGEVSKMPRGAVTVNRSNSSGYADSAGWATNAGHADSAGYSDNSNKLDGHDSGVFARTNVNEYFDFNLEVYETLKAATKLTSSDREFIVSEDDGQVYCHKPSNNSGYYVKTPGGYSSYSLKTYSSLRMGDVAIHLNDLPGENANHIYRQQSLVDFGVEPRLNEEGEECIFLLDIIEKMRNEMNELRNEINLLKGAK